MDTKKSKVIEKPKDFTPPEELFQRLIEKIQSYHPSDDLSLLHKAYRTAAARHGDQLRKSGEPYIIHPICVAMILADLELDKESIIAGILHDVVEDTDMTLQQVAQEFGEEIAMLVDGVTKLTQINWSREELKDDQRVAEDEIQAENLRKMFLAMAKDIRVILIKLADRLHNMRTLQYTPPHRQKVKAKETLDIFSPIAARLGISKVKTEMDDLALKYLEPEVYEELSGKIQVIMHERQEFISGTIAAIKAKLEEGDIHGDLQGRVKHLFSIYKKMITQNKTLDQIYDIFAIRIIVPTVRDCYAAFGIIHEMYTPVPGRIKDYIAMPKDNMYQSLHTTLMGKDGQPFEIQIRTEDMHRVAEYGIAAHWKYKEKGSEASGGDAEEEKLTWLRHILEWQRDMSDNVEFLHLIKSDLNLFSDNVYCFTPQGEVKTLPSGATPVDFAYAIHSAVGNRMVGARVNGKLVNIDYELHNGDRVEIMTSQNSKGPSRDWLKIVKSSQARNKIQQWFKSQLKDNNIQTGKDLLSAWCKNHGYTLSNYMKPEYQALIQSRYGFRDWDSVLAAIGHGGLKEGQVMNRILEEERKKKEESLTDIDILRRAQDSKMAFDKKGSAPIVVMGERNISTRLSKCCLPLPGDELVAYTTRGRGFTVHRSDCINVLHMSADDRARLIDDVYWVPAAYRNPNERFLTGIEVYCSNRLGILVDISKVFTEAEIDIKHIETKLNKGGNASIVISFEVKDKEELMMILRKVRQVESVMDIERVSS